MCGIAGIVDWNGAIRDLEDVVAAMSASLAHRGPDGSGSFIDHRSGLALGHRRLAIVDLTEKGRQPMYSSSGRYVVVLNGEIYNYRALREELTALGLYFRSTSDTEVLLEAVEQWGLAGALARLAGMFALALYDRKESLLYLVRDRIGEKPLYYGEMNGCFFFASELKAIRSLPCFESRVDTGALALYLRHNYIPAPYSIYRGVWKLRPGTWLKLDLNKPEKGFIQGQYWSLKEVIEARESGPAEGYSPEEAMGRFDRLLKAVVGEQMVADVPLGAFLSGGIDSSLVVAVMQALTAGRVKTFSIGFKEKGFNEAEQAGAVAAHLNTDHSELYVGPGEALALVPDLAGYVDEPFADSSLIPTCLVARLARGQVKVSLSGDGGDELFGGYNTYRMAEEIWAGLGKIPLPLRRLAAGGLRLFPDKSSRAGFGSMRLNGDRIRKLAGLMSSTTREILYQNLVSSWREPEKVALNSLEPASYFNRPGSWPQAGLNYCEWMMYLDMSAYLPDDILVKVDRAAMAVGLESRIPLLDYRVIEFAWGLPFDFKVRGGERKWLLKKLLGRYLPAELFARPKQGFSVPLDQWLRGPLKDWAGDLINAERLKKEGFFESGAVIKRWEEHLSGKRNWSQSLWNIFMFQAWYDMIRGGCACKIQLD